MAKSLERIGYTILEMVTNFRITDDEDIPIELIYDKIHNKRSEMAEAYYNKTGNVPEALYCELKCIDIECREVKCEGEDSEIKEHYVSLPNIDATFGDKAIKYLGSMDYKIPFRRLNFPFGANGKATKNAPIYQVVTYDNIILGEKLPTEGMDKIGAVYMCNMHEENCDPSKPYPIVDSWISRLEKAVFFDLVPSAKIPKDKKINADDDV